MKRSVGVLLIALLADLAGPGALAAQERTTLLKQAISLRCVFETGHGFAWRDGEFVGTNKEYEGSRVVFDRIDREEGHARSVYYTPTGNSRVDDVAVVEFEWRLGLSTYGLIFIEISDANNLIATRGHCVSMTTVWSPADPPADPSSYPAVFSSHSALIEPLPSQFRGCCHIED